MTKPELPKDEAARLQALRALNILDTLPEERFDRVTRLAKHLFGVETALVSLVDANRQWFKSKVGLDAIETPRDVSFCGHAILSDSILVIPDTSKDARFADNPLVTGAPNIRFYAGKPIRTASGHAMGTLCIIHSQPRQFTAEEGRLLIDLAKMVEDELCAVSLSMTDELTGLCNRRGFLTVGSHVLALCKRAKQSACMVFFDLNHFKEINDSLGHASGDEVLRKFAMALIEEFRESDVLGRLGGDEFAALCSGLQDAEIPIERFRKGLKIVAIDDKPLQFEAGAIFYDATRHTRIEDLIDEADRLMLSKKETR